MQHETYLQVSRPKVVSYLSPNSRMQIDRRLHFDDASLFDQHVYSLRSERLAFVHDHHGYLAGDLEVLGQ